MKTKASQGRFGFTLIELLVVIAIIAILAAMLLPAILTAGTKAKVQNAKLEIAKIVTAIQNYESQNNQLPASANALSSVAGVGQGFTFGTGGITPFQTPAGTSPITSTGTYQTNNAEVVAILMDLESYGDGRPTINKGHVKNPQHNSFLNAKLVSDTKSPGIGSDGVYRDPWGNPYIITLDLNYDQRARDSFYSSAAISADPASSGSPGGGLDGLVPKVVGGSTFYECVSPVMVWSAGPDKMIDPTVPANKGANKDNILSWK